MQKSKHKQNIFSLYSRWKLYRVHEKVKKRCQNPDCRGAGRIASCGAVRPVRGNGAAHPGTAHQGNVQLRRLKMPDILKRRKNHA